jgi:hypothetical protein
MWPRRLTFALCALILASGPTLAETLLPDGLTHRAIPFQVRDGKPFVATRIDGQDGVMMFDTGTPDALFLNRDALTLPPGAPVAQGRAASGQVITVQSHPAPDIVVDGQPFHPADHLRSGDFRFVQDGLGQDFLGFIGTPAVQDHAFTLDYKRQMLTLFRVGADGTLAGANLDPSDIVARIDFVLPPGEQPTAVALIGIRPILLDFDTGDSGTLYVTAATRTALVASGHLRGDGGAVAWLGGLVLGGTAFPETPVRIVAAGGPQDFRRTGQPDQLRLGAAFLARHPGLWNFPAHSLTFLISDSALLSPR